MKLVYNHVADEIIDVKVDKRTECFNYGRDNAFPSLVETLIGSSVTSKTCVDRVAKAIFGGGFGEKGDETIVNKKGQTLNEVFRIASREYAKHNAVYLQIGYDGNGDYKSIVCIPTRNVRLGKSDDKGYSGKFIVYDNWDKSKGTKIISAKFTVIDRYNPKKSVVSKQIERDGGIEKYNGQLIEVKKDVSLIYGETDLKPVLHEALLEKNSQIFRSRGADEGFLNTKLMAVQPFSNEDDRKEFQKRLNNVRGAKNSSNVVMLEASQQTDDLKNQYKLEDLSSEYNDKLFEYSDSQAEKNICKAFTVPLVLVNPTESGLFGNSGEMFKEAKRQLYESRKEEREQLEAVFVRIMKNFTNKVEDLSVINPFEEQAQ